MATLVVVFLMQACGGDPLPPPTGSIDGLVSIESEGVDGISVTLSNGTSVITANGGMYRFDGVQAGAYTIAISNYPADAMFHQTSTAVALATEGEIVTANFPGTWIRTSSIIGTVTVENEGLSGVTVRISGTGASETLTDGSGLYAFSGLRAGTYTVEISGFDEDDVEFNSTASAATVGVGESKIVSFEGTYLRKAAITGQVAVEGNGLGGVTVSLQGRGEDRTASTNGAGQFTFSELRSGDYSVGITNPDPDEYGFDVTSRLVTVAHAETKFVSFEGFYLRTAAITGQVSVEGTGLENVTVSLQGRGEERTTTTNSTGQYTFSELRPGDYSVGIANPDPDEYGFDVTSKNVTVTHGETASVPFDGILLRTAAIMGTVTVEGTGLAGVTVSVQGEGETFGAVTNEVGQFSFTELHAGDYSIGITGYDDDLYGFDVTTATVTVALQETATVPFTGIRLRTAGIEGTVNVEGQGVDGITVTVTGGPKDEGHTKVTESGGYYVVDRLHAGDYSVAISDFDADIHFDTTTQSVSVALRDTATADFAGTWIRSPGIAGTVTVEGIGLDGVKVTLAGDAEAEMQTADGGQYEFADLAAGEYTVAISGYDDDKFRFDVTVVTLLLEDTATVAFTGIRLRSAGIEGTVTVEGQGLEGITVTVTGGPKDEEHTRATDSGGYYIVDQLHAGDYAVAISDFDANEYEFEATTQAISVGLRDTATVAFQGAFLPTPYYDIVIVHTDWPALSEGQRRAFTRAERFWETAIRGNLGAVRVNKVLLESCLDQGEIEYEIPGDRLVEDLLIYADVREIDGRGGILAAAGPCLIRAEGALPIVGIMYFDAEDLDELEQMEGGRHLDGTILHEIAHVMGFGAIWEHLELLVDAVDPNNPTGDEDPHFVGDSAIQAFFEVGGDEYTGGDPVPAENLGGAGSVNSHWREFVFGAELMSPFLDGGVPNPLSIVTLASFQDLGYTEVDMSVADEFELPSSSPRRAGDHVHRWTFDGDILRIPLAVVDRDGTVIRYVTPRER